MLRAFLKTGLLVIAVLPIAFAREKGCGPLPPLDKDPTFSGNLTIFVGRIQQAVQSKMAVAGGVVRPIWEVDFKVLRLVKEQVPPNHVVHVSMTMLPTTWGNPDPPFKVEEDWLVFASQVNVQGKTFFVSTSCSRSRPIAEARDDLTQLMKTKSPK